MKVTREWKLGPFGSGEAVLGCPTGYGVQFNSIGGPNFGSSNSAISATPVGYTSTAVTMWVTNWNPFKGPNTALPSQIFVNATQPYTGAQARAWGAALTLVVIAFIAMLIARFFTARFTKNSR